MKELMLRLIKDGKIVGYEWHRKAAPDAKILTVWFQRYGNPGWMYDGESGPIDHDTIELGIKYGERWWFEGDLIAVYGDDPGILFFDEKTYDISLKWEDEGHVNHDLALWYVRGEGQVKGRVGNIHKALEGNDRGLNR